MQTGMKAACEGSLILMSVIRYSMRVNLMLLVCNELKMCSEEKWMCTCTDAFVSEPLIHPPLMLNI